MWQLIEEFEELILRGMSTKDIEREHRLKAESDKNHQESNLKDAIDEAHASMKNAFAEAFREIELEVERYLIKRRNRRLHLEEANKEVNRIDISLEETEMKSNSGTQTTDYADTEIVTVDISELTANVNFSEKTVVEDQINLFENECDYDEHDDNMSDLDDLESFNIINESEDSFSFDTKFSELSTIDEQSEFEIVNDNEVDWNENIIFEHLTIESQQVVTEQQPMEVECLLFHSKCCAEMTTQQQVTAMKHVATDVEVFKTNVLNVEIELNSFAQFEKGLPRQVWDPGLKCVKILL